MLSRLLDSAAKRAMDVALASAGIAVTWPAMLVIAAAIFLEDRDSALYVQQRIGKDKTPFSLLKFRTMRTRPAQQQGLQVTVGDDPRITKIGKLLRDTRLDELPQLINILKGDMSVVGPRPEVARYVEHYTAEELTVLSVRPGLTDPATLAYRHEADRLANSTDPEATYIQEIMPEKLAMNIQYLKERNTLKDFEIFVDTIITLLEDRLER